MAETEEWTRVLISNIETWCNRSHGQLSIHITQLLSGHSCFGKYLQRIDKEATSACHHCWVALDDARHTMFDCEVWETERNILYLRLGGKITITTLAETIMGDIFHWSTFAEFCQKVMQAKEAAERIRRGEQRD